MTVLLVEAEGTEVVSIRAKNISLLVMTRWRTRKGAGVHGDYLQCGSQFTVRVPSFLAH
jgi:hypothetical protein